MIAVANAIRLNDTQAKIIFIGYNSPVTDVSTLTAVTIDAVSYNVTSYGWKNTRWVVIDGFTGSGRIIADVS